MEELNLWFEKYRPKKLSDCILSKKMKDIFQGYVDKKEIPNLLLTGYQGTGKTTLAKVLVNELNTESLFIDCSTESGKQMIQDQVVPFASTISLGENNVPKIIICDESDGLNPNAQRSMRPIIEKYAINTRFIFTGNYSERIIPAIKSRCACFDFTYNKKEMAEIMTAIFKRCKYILDDNGVKYDKKSLQLFIAKWYPDFRRIINELQSYATGYGVIDEGILSSATKDDIADQIYPLILAQDFKKSKEWVANSVESADDIFNALYTKLNDYVQPELQPSFIILLAQYQEYSSHVMNQQINTMALLTELMSVVGGK